MLDVELECVDLEYLKDISGERQKKPLIEFLIREGYKFSIRKDGWPRVTKAFIAHKLGPDFNNEQDTCKRGNHNALRAMMGTRIN